MPATVAFNCFFALIGITEILSHLCFFSPCQSLFLTPMESGSPIDESRVIAVPIVLLGIAFLYRMSYILSSILFIGVQPCCSVSTDATLFAMP